MGMLQQNRALCRPGRAACHVHITYVHEDVDELRSDWDPAKARLTQRKHGIAFEEAQTVVADEDAILLADVSHAAGEERCDLLGPSAKLRVLMVIHRDRSDDGPVRLIPARKATPSERVQYGARWTR